MYRFLSTLRTRVVLMDDDVRELVKVNDDGSPIKAISI